MMHSKTRVVAVGTAAFGALLMNWGCSAGISSPETMDLATNNRATRARAEPAVQCPTPCKPQPCTVVSPGDALITDWKDVAPGGMFVDDDAYSNPSPNWWKSFFGGPYVYPADDPCSDAAAPAYPLVQTVDGKWNIKGKVGTWSGFGLWFAPCDVDMSAYRGVSFTIWGEVGDTKRLNFNVVTSEDSKPSECLTNVGTCDPATNDCKAPAKKLEVPARPGEPITVLWSELSGGSPLPGVDPTQITGFHFAFERVEWNGIVTPPFPVDVTFGAIQLVK
jgi:hypothetical protein